MLISVKNKTPQHNSVVLFVSPRGLHSLTYSANTEFIVYLALCGGFPGDSVVKNLPDNAGEEGSLSGSGRSPEKGDSNPLQHSCLGRPRDSGACQATVHGVARLRRD